MPAITVVSLNPSITNCTETCERIIKKTIVLYVRPSLLSSLDKIYVHSETMYLQQHLSISLSISTSISIYIYIYILYIYIYIYFCLSVFLSVYINVLKKNNPCLLHRFLKSSILDI